MQRHHFLVAILAFAIVCGLFHPLMPPVIVLSFHLVGRLLFGFTPLILLFSSLLFATACVIVAGIPAALFERLTGRQESDEASLWVWLAGMAVISLPAFGNLFRFGF